MTEHRVQRVTFASSVQLGSVRFGGISRLQDSERPMITRPEHPRNTILVVDDDNAIVELVTEALFDEGYAVTGLRDSSIDAIREAIVTIQPDCVLLDGALGSGYGNSWEVAALMTALIPPVPVIMFTAHVDALAEAKAQASERSRAARFAALIQKPFELSDLFDAVESAIGKS
jgi:CheY-like chemotaxis protein